MDRMTRQQIFPPQAREDKTPLTQIPLYRCVSTSGIHSKQYSGEVSNRLISGALYCTASSIQDWTSKSGMYRQPWCRRQTKGTLLDHLYCHLIIHIVFDQQENNNSTVFLYKLQRISSFFVVLQNQEAESIRNIFHH